MADIDDVWLNTLGAWIGVAVANRASRRSG